LMRAKEQILGTGDPPVATAGAPRGELPASTDAAGWLFTCECDRTFCEERVVLTLSEYEELRSRRAPVLAPGHRARRTAQTRRTAAELREEAQALKAQAAQQSSRAQKGVEQATERAARNRRLIALGKANEVRIARAALKRQLHAGDVQVTQILAAPPRCATTASVLDLLLAVPKVGPVRARRLLTAARVSETTKVGRLTERQRSELIVRLPG
jgi:hypothetical protein